MMEQAEQLVRERITGTRKGMDKPACTHSFNVRDILARHGFSGEVQLAGLLHDVIEDGGVSLDELTALGFGDRVVELVNLASHDLAVEGSYERWVKMIARLIDATDAEAWAIKLADIRDNLRDSHAMPNKEQQLLLREVKVRLMLELTKNFNDLSGLRQELANELKAI